MENSPNRTQAQKALASIRDFNFLQLLKVVQRRWRWMFLGILGGIAAAVVYSQFAEKKYESVAAIFVMKKDTALPTVGAGNAPADTAVNADLLATHLEIIRSKRIVREALNTDGLAETPSITEQLDSETTADDYVIDNLTVTRGAAGQSKNAHILTIAFQHTSPEDSQKVVNAVLASYQSFLDTTFKDVNSEAANLIRQAKEGLEEELKESEGAYTKFRAEAPLLFKGDESSNIHRDRFDQVQADISQLQLDVSEARARLEAVNDTLKIFDELKVPDIQRLSVIDDKNAARIALLISVDRPESLSAEFQALMPERAAAAHSEFQHLASLQAKEKTLLLTHGPEHPDVKSVRSEISFLKELLAKKQEKNAVKEIQLSRDPKAIVEAYVNFLENDLSAATLREKHLRILAEESEIKAKELVKYELEGETLRQDVKRKQDLYDTVVDRLREINLAGDYGGFINEVVASAEVGELVWPDLPICIALGAIGGIAIGALAVFAAELRDQSFRDPTDIKAAFDLPILSHIPMMTERIPFKQLNGTVAPSLMVFYKPKSREAEVFRGLRTQLLFNFRESNLRVVQFTSPKQGDGKSTILSNLAISLARAGRRVLLVDADLRRPTLHKLFGISAKVGLSDLLDESGSVGEAIVPSAVENLSVLTAGKIPQNPTELLERPAFGTIVAGLRDQFDLVMIDSPPVLPVADPCIVSSHVDSVAMVIRIGNDSKPEAVRAQELLIDVGAKVLGIIVNGAVDGRSDYEYGVYGKLYQAYGEDAANGRAAQHASEGGRGEAGVAGRSE